MVIHNCDVIFIVETMSDDMSSKSFFSVFDSAEEAFQFAREFTGKFEPSDSGKNFFEFWGKGTPGPIAKVFRIFPDEIVEEMIS